MISSSAEVPRLKAAVDTASFIDSAFTFPPRGSPPHGASVAISVRTALESDEQPELLLEVCKLAAAVPVCLQPVDLPGLAEWEQFCGALQDVAMRQQAPMRALATAVHSHQLPISGFCQITDSYFGDGPRFVFLDGLQIHGSNNDRAAAATAANWTCLWRERRRKRPVLPVYGGVIKSACPLLADEVAVSVLPESGLLVPAETAWIPVSLDLAVIAGTSAAVDTHKLRAATRAALCQADRLVDQVLWHGAQQRADARQNRRIALTLTGIGDLAVALGADPRDLGCLGEFQRLIGVIREELDSTSAWLAQRLGEAPALSSACPPGDWFDGSHNQLWRTRFEAARRGAAVRNRNLLAMSPYSVLPTSAPASPRYMDLLPLLSFADAWAFAGAPRLSAWNVTQFKHFHRRARAIIQASQSVSRIAAEA